MQSDRKADHIQLAKASQVIKDNLDQRFYYEPMLGVHPTDLKFEPIRLAGKTIEAPLWVSSMTGGTSGAREININLARACRKFKMGFGLGSCRPLLHSKDRFADFDVRDHLGEEQPLFANIGIAQLEELLQSKAEDAIDQLVYDLRADGCIIHVNPLQEFLQPEGDRFARRPLESIATFLEKSDTRVIVKEVGQGMGPASLRMLMRLPVVALEFGAAGGTNFSQLELSRSNKNIREAFSVFANVGHSAEEMVEFIHRNMTEIMTDDEVPLVIVSGGIRSFLDGYYLMRKLRLPAIYAQASAFLAPAMDGEKALDDYIAGQLTGLKMAMAYLRVR